MTTTTISNGQALQTPQDETGNVFLLTGNSTVVSAGADLIFGSNTPTDTSTIFDTGIAAIPGGYQGDTVVLGASSATVLVGGIGSTIYGGSGHANLFFDAQATVVTGKGDMTVVGNQTGAGFIWGGGELSAAHNAAGTLVTTGLGAHIELCAAAPV